MLTGRSAKTIEVPIPIRVDKLTEILRIKGVPVSLHWSVLLIILLILFNVIRHPIESLLAIVAYLGVLLIHETGHLIAAQKMRCEVLAIRLYPIFGITDFETPWSKFDHCVIAWGGVVAQAIVAIPIVAGVELFGHSRFEAINAVLGLLGYFSLAIAFLNLLPIKPLDGYIAWAIIPEWFKRLRNRQYERSGKWR